MSELPPLWPHQEAALRDIAAALRAGERRLLLTSPTGGGKSRIIGELIRWHVAHNPQRRAVVYTNRKILVSQLARSLTRWAIPYGIRSAGHPFIEDEPVQISSLPTERTRTIERANWTPHGIGYDTIVLIDECHMNAGQTAQHMMTAHLDAGHAIIGVTATPLGLSHLYDKLIIAGTNSQLRECGAIVQAIHFAPTDPPTKNSHSPTSENNTTPSEHKCRALWGHVLYWFRQLNPHKRPTILFAPGVPESAWFAHEFVRAGIPAAHIDAQHIWVHHQWLPSDIERRDRLIEHFRRGHITVLCNRFVLREGVDIPEASHGILATTFSSLQSYIQAGGRLLRKHPSHDHVTIQDHGGNWWLHGSLNADRAWELSLTDAIASHLRHERLRAGQDPEPYRCPRCTAISYSLICPQCGHDNRGKPRVRPVIQSDGSLIEVTGPIFRKRKVTTKPDTEQKWRSVYHAAKNSRRPMTFQQAWGWFAKKEGYCCPRNLPLMPKRDIDWYRNVSDVPTQELR